MGNRVPVGTRQALVAALRERYQAGARREKARILEEFVEISRYHRKSAIRILNGTAEVPEQVRLAQRARVYDNAVGQGLVVLWEASYWVRGKRLRALLPLLLPALERHGHLQLDPVVFDRGFRSFAKLKLHLLSPVG